MFGDGRVLSLFQIKSAIIQRGRVGVAVILACFAVISGQSYAAAPQDGYFYGVEMDPVGSANISAVETEPAVALVFAVDQETADITRQFDAWFQGANRPQVGVFAIGVVPEGMSRDVAVTAIEQRNLHMPVFLAVSDILMGEDYRLLVLNNDMETARFLTLNWAEAYDALEKAGVSVTAEPPVTAATAVTTATVSSTPVPSAATRASAATPTTAIVTTATAATTTARVTPAEPTPDKSKALVLGGEDSDGIYINKLYGMRVQFPPGWKYRVSGKRDGAVAIEPRGSRMDMRIWALAAEDVNSPQQYVDKRLDSIAKSNRTRVQVERQMHLNQDGLESMDVTFTYTKPIDENAPARGGLIWRGRLLVVMDNGLIKAAAVNAPGGEFLATFPFVDSFIRSFRAVESDKIPAAGYSQPNVI